MDHRSLFMRHSLVNSLHLFAPAAIGRSSNPPARQYNKKPYDLRYFFEQSLQAYFPLK